jgi:hypothetical protein
MSESEWVVTPEDLRSGDYLTLEDAEDVIWDEGVPHLNNGD